MSAPLLTQSRYDLDRGSMNSILKWQKTR